MFKVCTAGVAKTICLVRMAMVYVMFLCSKVEQQMFYGCYNVLFLVTVIKVLVVTSATSY